MRPRPTSYVGRGLTRMHCAVLDGFLYAAGAQATRANVRCLGMAVDQDTDALQVGLKATLAGHVGVAPAVTDDRPLATADADFRHACFLGLIQ